MTGDRLLRIVAPTPIEVAIWLPPLAVLCVAIVAHGFAGLKDRAS